MFNCVFRGKTPPAPRCPTQLFPTADLLATTPEENFNCKQIPHEFPTLDPHTGSNFPCQIRTIFPPTPCMTHPGSKNKNKRLPVIARLYDSTRYFDHSKFKIQSNDINMQNVLNYNSQLNTLRYTKFKKYRKADSRIFSVSSNDLGSNLHDYEIENEDEQTDIEITHYKEQLHSYNTRLVRYFQEEDYCIYCRTPGHLQRFCP